MSVRLCCSQLNNVVEAHLHQYVSYAQKSTVREIACSPYQGMAGVVVNPLSGTLAAASRFTEGLDASSKVIRKTVAGESVKMTRRRLPRCIKGDTEGPWTLCEGVGGYVR